MSETVSFYKYSLYEAKRANEKKLWTDSHKENIRCAKAIDKAISDNYKDNCLFDCAEELIREFGFQRLNYVLALNVKVNNKDDRFSPDNKEWANRFYIPLEKENKDFFLRSHIGLINIFVNQARKEWDNLGLFDINSCVSEKSGQMDYTGKILVLDPYVLKDEYKTSDNQLFLAETGFGCSPNSRGRKVFGRFLNDGEKTHYYREEFLGALKPELIPEWVKSQIEENSEESGMELGGI